MHKQWLSPPWWRRLPLSTALVLATLLTSLLAAAFPSAAARAQACSELVANGGFEANGGWQFSSGAVLPQYVTSPVHSGARALQLGSTGGSSVQGYSSARQTVTILAGVSQATLSFWYSTQFSGSTAGDYAELAFLSSDGSVVLAKPWQITADSPTWQQATFDVSGLQGQTIQLYFSVYNTGAGGSAALFLDDVSLAACGPLPGTGTPAPAGTSNPTPIVAATVPPAFVSQAPAFSPTPGCTELIQNGSFTDGLGNWVGVGDANGITTASDLYQSPPYSLKLGSLDQNLNGLSGVQQAVTIPADSPSVMLDVWVFPQSQPDPGADYQEIALLNSSGGLLFVPYRGPANESSWVRLQFNLAAFAGETVYLRFAVNNDGAGGHSVMYVDDVSLTACSSGAQPAPTVAALPSPLPTEAPQAALPPPPPPVIPAAPAGCAELTRNGGFEDGLTGWMPGANPLQPALVTSPVLSGSYAAQLGTVNQNISSYSSIRQTVTVPYGYARTLVSFWTYTWAEDLSGPDRQEFVLLGPGNVVWAVPWKVLENRQAWQQHMYEIVGVAGQTFDLYFAAINDGLGGCTALYLDEVHLWGCGGAVPLAQSEQTQGAAAPAQAEAVPVLQVYPVETMPVAPVVEQVVTATLEAAPAVPEVQWTQVAIVTPSVADVATAVSQLSSGAAPATTPPPPETTAAPQVALTLPVGGTPVVAISVSLTPQPASFLSDITSRLPTGGKLAVIGLVILLVVLLVIALLRGRSAPVE